MDQIRVLQDKYSHIKDCKNDEDIALDTLFFSTVYFKSELNSSKSNIKVYISRPIKL